MIALAGGGDPGSAALRRRGLEHLKAMAEDPPDPAVTSQDLTVDAAAGPIGMRLYDPGGAPGPVLVYFHGGGWVAGDLETHDGLCRRLALAARIKLLAVDYRRAPEHTFPAPIEDGLAAMRWLVEQAAGLGVDPARIGIGGDSAGAGVAAAVALILRDAGGPAIALQLLICPILDVARESPSRREFAEGYFLDHATMAADLADYLPPGADPADPRLSPLLAEQLDGLPPALVHSAQYDPFRDEAAAYAQRLAAAGVSVQLTEHAGMIHYFYALPRAIPYARDAAEAIGTQLRALLNCE